MQRGHYFFVGLLLSFLLIFQAGTALAAPVQITSQSSNQGRPDVEGTLIVWKDFRAGNWDIYAHNLLTGVEEPVATAPSYENVPVTNGTVVVWQDNRSGANDIYMKNMATGVTELLVSGPGNQGLPAIDGNTVVYVDDVLGSNDIFAIDIVSRIITTVSVDPGNQWQPRVSGKTVIWEDDRNGNWDIYSRDLSGGGETPAATGPGDQRVGDIDGGTIVWLDYTGGRYDIWMKELGSGTAEAVTDDTDYQTSPRISRDLIVWENYDYADDNYDILARDLTTGETLVVAGGPQIQARPAIDRETVVWEEEDAGSYNVWMERIEDVTPPGINGLSPADGEDCGCQAPLIEATFSDNRSGVDTYSVQLIIDGEDVTAEASVNGSSIAYQAPLADGNHTAELALSDIAGNTASKSWQFVTEAPRLELDYAGSFWASYGDYVNRELSVEYDIRNTSAGAGTAATEIVAATATSGAFLTSLTPVSVGTLAPSSSSRATVKYLVPMSVNSFRSTVYVRLEGTCGTVNYLPGQPPAF